MPSTLDDRLKRIPIFLPDSYLSFGGEARLRYDYQNNPEWGQELQDDAGAFLQRYLLHGNLDLGTHVRVFGELRSALENGRAPSASPVEKGQLDLQQAFIEFRGDVPSRPISLGTRMGRQEMFFGSERLVSVREGPNIRRRFDGVRGDVLGERFTTTVLGAYLTENEEGVFTDGINEDVATWALYNVLVTPLRLPSDVDVYYIGYRDADATFVEGQAKELRHSVGIRLHGDHRALDWNWEGVLQWGEFGQGDILAWTVASETGYRFEQLPFAPRFALSANVASGDKDPDDGDLETFNPLFPRGNYFSHLALLGPRNFVNLHPGLGLTILDSLVLGTDANFYWRLETSDGIYGPSGNILRQGTDTDERYVGWAVSASLDWNANRFVFFGFVYTHAFAGGFIEETGPSEDIDFVEVTFRVRF